MVIRTENVTKVDYPLESFRDEGNFRLYPNDIGFLIARYDYGMIPALLQEDDRSPVAGLAKGGIYEALIADMLKKRGYETMKFYRSDDGRTEEEFLLENMDGVIPIEVKAGRKRSASLDKLMKLDIVPYAYKLADQNVGQNGKLITLPLYMAIFL